MVRGPRRLTLPDASLCTDILKYDEMFPSLVC